MDVKSVISALEKIPSETIITLFDDKSIPHIIDHIVIDTDGNGELSHIVIKPIELT